MSECVRETVRGAGKGWNEKCLVDKAKYLRLGQRPSQSQGEAAGASGRGFIVMLVFREFLQCLSVSGSGLEE